MLIEASKLSFIPCTFKLSECIDQDLAERA